MLVAVFFIEDNFLPVYLIELDSRSPKLFSIN